MIRIVNKKNFKGEGVYIGRPSPLGNPFVLGRDGNRDEVIRKYSDYITREIENNDKVRKELNRILELSRKGDVNLICWCAPKKCHGDVIKFIIEESEIITKECAKCGKLLFKGTKRDARRLIIYCVDCPLNKKSKT